MSDPATAQPVTVYWRPGCGFCAGLLRGLEKAGLAHQRVNIWEDEAAAAHVRSVANGNETVPTVTVGDTSMVNPSVDQVMATVAEQHPEHLPEGWTPPEPGRMARTVNKLLGG